MRLRATPIIRLVHHQPEDQCHDSLACHPPLDDFADAVECRRDILQVQVVFTGGIRKPDVVPAVEGLQQEIETTDPATPLERIPALFVSLNDLASSLVELGVDARVRRASSEK